MLSIVYIDLIIVVKLNQMCINLIKTKVYLLILHTQQRNDIICIFYSNVHARKFLNKQITCLRVYMNVVLNFNQSFSPHDYSKIYSPNMHVLHMNCNTTQACLLLYFSIIWQHIQHKQIPQNINISRRQANDLFDRLSGGIILQKFPTWQAIHVKYGDVIIWMNPDF